MRLGTKYGIGTVLEHFWNLRIGTAFWNIFGTRIGTRLELELKVGTFLEPFFGTKIVPKWGQFQK